MEEVKMVTDQVRKFRGRFGGGGTGTTNQQAA